MPKRRVKRHSVVQPQDQSYKLIPLTQGQNALVDAEDFERLDRWHWFAHTNGHSGFYAVRKPRDKYVFMHHEVFGEKVEIDHRNGNSLDNRKQNLRKCDASQNKCNQPTRRDSKSGYKGVHKVQRGWQAMICKNGNDIHVGFFQTPEEAALAYNKAAKEIHGDFAFLNQIVPPVPNPYP